MILDPIDGTRGFIRQEPYAIALALIEDGEVVLGVLGCPRQKLEGHTDGVFLVAVKGQGCFLIPSDSREEIPLHVKESTEIIYCEPHLSSQTHSHSMAHEIAKD